MLYLYSVTLPSFAHRYFLEFIVVDYFSSSGNHLILLRHSVSDNPNKHKTAMLSFLVFVYNSIEGWLYGI